MHEAPHQAIDALFLKERRYPPPPELAKEANAQPGIYDRDFAEFWASEARERVTWSTPFDQVCDWDPPYARWFHGGRLNVMLRGLYNEHDRYVQTYWSRFDGVYFAGDGAKRGRGR